MLKKFSLFLFISIFSLQAAELPKFTNINNELTHLRLTTLQGAISVRSVHGITAVAFYNNIQQIEQLKKYFENTKNGYLIATDINTTEQEIKDVFNIKEPTLIYYNNDKEIARSNDFDINITLQHIKNIAPPTLEPSAFKYSLKIPRFSEVNALIQELYDETISTFSKIPGMSKFLPKKPLTCGLAQIHLLSLLGSFLVGSMEGGVTVVAFYNNAQKIESLKNLVEQQKSTYLIAADINETEQEIKDIFNIIMKPTIIYYSNKKEVARSSNFETKEVLRHITIISMISRLQ